MAYREGRDTAFLGLVERWMRDAVRSREEEVQGHLNVSFDQEALDLIRVPMAPG